MTVDLVIKNGKIVTHFGIFEGGIAIEEGKVRQVSHDSLLPESGHSIDVGGKVIMPGLIDAHVHLGIYHDYEGDVKSETRSAVCGGVTAIIHQLLGYFKDPPFESQLEAFDRYKEPIEKLSSVDIALMAVLGRDRHLLEVPKLVELGVANFKFFLHSQLQYSWTQGSPDAPMGTGSFPIIGVDDGFLFEGFELIRDVGGLAHIHAENCEIHYRLKSRFTKRMDPLAYAESRPHFCEELDMETVGRIAQITNCPVYFVHCSIGTGLDIVNEFRRRSVETYLETVVHYLTIDKTGANLKEGPWGAKTNPPPRTKEDIEKLWLGIRRGDVDVVATDHDHNKYSEHFPQDRDIWKVLLGMGYIELLLPLMLSEGFHKRGISLEKIAEVRSYNVAKIHGVYPRKGVIMPNADADLVVVDTKKKRRVTAAMLHGGSDFTVYEGWELTGWPVLTVLRGNIMMEEHEPTGKEGTGRYLPCVPGRARLRS